MSIQSKILAEFLGTAGLLIAAVGSGIMGESLSGGNAAIALLANSLATGAGLFVLIQCLGPISGAHFNPVVSLVEVLWGRLNRRELPFYWGAQFFGGLTGVVITHAMFNQALLQVATKARDGLHLGLSEFVATFGLILTIALAGRKHVEFAPVSIAAYITGAYWFTSSTSFANPVVTVARAFTDTFSGIALHSIPLFILAQFLGMGAAYFAVKKLGVQT